MSPNSLGLARCVCRPLTLQSLTVSTRSGVKRASLHSSSTLRGVRSQSALSKAPTLQSTYLQSNAVGRRFASTRSSSDSTDTNAPSLNGAPDISTYYSIFPRTIPAGPPPATPFEVSQSDLRREFLQLQNTVHPDKYPSGDEKQHAEALSARINEAYRTLLDPLQRAQYLLREWHGIDVTAEDASTKHALDPETLMEVMEVQETIEEVGAEPEAEAAINNLMKENDSRIEACVNALGSAFDRGDIESARKETIRLRFWYSVGEGLREWEPGNTEIRLVHGS